MIERAEGFIREDIADGASGGTIQDESEGAISGVVRGEEENGLPEIRIHQPGMGNQKRAGEAQRGGLKLTHVTTLRPRSRFSSLALGTRGAPLLPL